MFTLDVKKTSLDVIYQIMKKGLQLFLKFVTLMVLSKLLKI